MGDGRNICSTKCINLQNSTIILLFLSNGIELIFFQLKKETQHHYGANIIQCEQATHFLAIHPIIQSRHYFSSDGDHFFNKQLYVSLYLNC